MDLQPRTEKLRVFVAGGSGVIGRRVVRLLAAAGHQVSALTRDQRKAGALAELGAVPVVGDAFDAEQLAELVAEARPEVVIHQLTDLAAYDTAANARLRRTGTANLVAAAQAAGVSRMIAQSIAWAYEPTDRPAAESVPLDLGAADPRGATVSGIEALESAVLSLSPGSGAVVLRYGMLYGPDTWFTPTGRQGTAAREGRLVADRSVTSFVHVDDAAAAAVAALDWPSGAVNVVDDEPAQGQAWTPDFCAYVGAAAPELVDTAAAWAVGASNAYAAELGWTPRHPTWRDNWGAG